METTNAEDERRSRRDPSSKQGTACSELNQTRKVKLSSKSQNSRKSKTSPGPSSAFPLTNNESHRNPKSKKLISSRDKQTERHQSNYKKQSTTEKANAVIAIPPSFFDLSESNPAGSSPNREHSAKSKSDGSRSSRNEGRYQAAAVAQATSCRQRQRRRKKIHWNKNIRVKIIHNLQNYTRQERRDTWYSANEYSRMEDECELTSILMDEIMDRELKSGLFGSKNGKPKISLPSGFCDRGLESWTIRGEELKETRVQRVIDTVWQAQIDAWKLLDKIYSSSKAKTIDDYTNEKIHNECWDFIRRKSVKASALCSVVAERLASKDEKAIIPYLNAVRSLERSRRIASMASGENNRNQKDSSPSKFRNSNSTKSCANTTSILKRSAPMRSRSDSHTIRKSYFDSANTNGESILSPPRRSRSQAPSVRGKVSSDFNPRRPVRLVSPTTPSKSINHMNFDHGLGIDITASGGNGVRTDERSVATEVSGGVCNSIKKNKNMNSPGSSSSISSIRSKERKIKLKSKSSDRSRSNECVGKKNGSDSPGSLSNSSSSTRSKKKVVQLQSESGSGVSSIHTVKNQIHSDSPGRRSASSSNSSKTKEIRLHSKIKKDRSASPMRSLGSTAVNSNSSDNCENGTSSLSSAGNTSSISSKKKKTQLHSKIKKDRAASVCSGNDKNCTSSVSSASYISSTSNKKKKIRLQRTIDTETVTSQGRSIASTKSSSSGKNGSGSTSSKKKKIQFQQKSKTKIPTSPVQNVRSSLRNINGSADIDEIDEEDSLSLKQRMMLSHMNLSTSSDDSMRRRMLRAVPIGNSL